MILTDLNRSLEIVNGNLSILRFEFLLFLIVYLFKYNHQLKWYDWFVALPLGAAVALSLAINDIGELGRSFTVWLSRAFHLGTPLIDSAIGVITVFTLIAGIGLLMMIRVFSKPFYGNWPWIVCTASCILFTIASLLIHH